MIAMTAEHPDTPGDRDRTPVNDAREGKGTEPDEDIIRIEHLTKVFENARTVVAVDDVSLTVQRGEIFGLLGPNGAGKSTLIRILTTLMKPTSGTASIESYDVIRYPEKIRSRIGVCPQNSTLDLELSAYDNLDFYGRLQNVDDTTLATRIPELLGMVDLAGRADARVSTFSGGMRRKLEIVRAFIHHPSILFLDEPTIGLDPESRREVWKQITRLNTEETTIILTTHYMDEAEKLCDRIAFMEGGRLISLDTPENLKRAMPGGDLIEIGFSELREGILPAVRSHASVVSVEMQGQKMLISAHEGSSLLPVLLADFERFLIPVTSISIRSPSLEDVFIYLTGKKLDDSGVNGPVSPPGRIT
jgi:ABC-2 type transport system ATP-binding protein